MWRVGQGAGRKNLSCREGFSREERQVNPFPRILADTRIRTVPFLIKGTVSVSVEVFGETKSWFRSGFAGFALLMAFLLLKS